MDNQQPQGGQNAPNPLLASLASTIQGVMSQDELDRHQWLRFENFISEKAREMRTERLKRSAVKTTDMSVSSSSLPRKILKVKRRQ